MALDIYWIGLLILVPTVAFAAGHNVILKPLRARGWMNAGESREKSLSHNRRNDETRKFRRTFLQVYLLVMGSEWLQGPYMYTLLRDEKGLSESSVALLYTTAYSSAAATAFVTGWLADRFGRRAACLAFCGIHCLASVSVLSSDLRVLTAGRVAGGIAITLLWTAFESWMVAEWNARNLNDDEDENGMPGRGGLAAMFGLMTTANCITAISAGVLSHCVVLALGSKRDPFLIGMALDVCAAILMFRTWNENHGVGGKPNRCTKSTEGSHCELEEADTSPRMITRPKNAGDSLRDIRVWILSFVSCCFEGTIFLLMFFWPGALQEAHARENPDEDETANAVPYGVTFACFMGTMVLGALLFNALVRHHHRAAARAYVDVDSDSDKKSEMRINCEDGSRISNKGSSGESDEVRSCWKRNVATVLTPTRLMAVALFLAAASFLVAAFAHTELSLFAAFLILEACNGIYVPSIAFHRSAVVDEEGRASIYGIMNIPLFIFVVVALCTTSGRGGEHRQTVFLFCAALLLAAVVATVFGLRDLGRRQGFSQLPVRECEDAGCNEEFPQ